MFVLLVTIICYSTDLLCSRITRSRLVSVRLYKGLKQSIFSHIQITFEQKNGQLKERTNNVADHHTVSANGVPAGPSNVPAQLHINYSYPQDDVRKSLRFICRAASSLMITVQLRCGCSLT